MEICSFSVLLDLILNGTKKRTMRSSKSKKWKRIYAKWLKGKGKIPIYIQIYWKHRTKESKKLFDAKITDMEIKCLSQLTEDELKLDGFLDREQCYAFFYKNYKNDSAIQKRKENTGTFEVFIIQFEKIHLKPSKQSIQKTLI